MTCEEMKRRFADEWVLLADPEPTELQEVVRGTVLFHSDSRDKVYQQLQELRTQGRAPRCRGVL